MTGWTADSAKIDASGKYTGAVPTTTFTADGALAPAYVSDPALAPSYLQRIYAAIAPILSTQIISSTSIKITWQAIFNAATYNLYRNGVLIDGGETALTFTDTGLTAGTTYKYTITSVNARAGEGPASAAVSGTTSAGISTVRNYPGFSWGVSLNASQQLGGIPNSSGGTRADAGPVTAATGFIVVRLDFNQINSGGTTYTAGDTKIQKWLDDLALFNATPSKNTGLPNVLLYVMVTTRNFAGSSPGLFTADVTGKKTGTLSTKVAAGSYGITFQDAAGAAGNVLSSQVNATVAVDGLTVTWTANVPAAAASILDCALNPMSNCPMPSDIQFYSECFLQSAGNPALQGGWQGWRWSPTVLTRFNATCVHLAAKFDTHPNWGGVGTQETASGGAMGGTGVDAYNAPAPAPAGSRMIGACNAENDAISTNFVHGRHLDCFNFINGNQPGTLLTGHLDHVQANGALAGPPDWATARAGGGLPGRVYPWLADYINGANGISGKGPGLIWAQNGEWTGTAAGDPVFPSTGKISFEDLYNYATQSNTYTTNNALDHSPTASVIAQRSVLNVPLAIVDWHTTGAAGTFADVVPIMKAHPKLPNWWTPT